MKLGKYKVFIGKKQDNKLIWEEKPYFIIDFDGKIIDTNKKFSEIIGKSKENIINKKIEDIGSFSEEKTNKNEGGTSISFFSLQLAKGNKITLKNEIKPYIKNGKIIGEKNIVKDFETINEINKKEKPKKIKTTSRGLEFLNSLENVIEKTENLRHFQEELEDAYYDLNFHRDELQSITRRWVETQVVLEERDYEIRKLNSELRRLQKKVETRQEEVYLLQDKIKNDEPKSLKYESSSNGINARNFEKLHPPEIYRKINLNVEQEKEDLLLKRQDLLQKNKELKELKSKLLKTKEQEIILEKPITSEDNKEQINFEIKEITEELKKGNLTFNWFKEELEKIKTEKTESNEELMKKIKLINKLEEDLRKKQQKIDKLSEEIGVRNEIISNFRKTQEIQDSEINKKEYDSLKRQYEELEEDHIELKKAVENLLIYEK